MSRTQDRALSGVVSEGRAIIDDARGKTAQNSDPRPQIVERQIVEQPKTLRRRRGARTQPHAWLWFACGCGLAIVFMELVLHNFSGKYENSAGSEIRNFREGLAKSHFLPNGLRVTGNPQIAGAPDVLIVGDSHVEAFQVSDEQTMGAVLERRLRAEGKQWNVLQYGWSGADGPDYVYAAPLLLEKFPSRRIFLIMNDGDFGSAKGETARLVERNGAVVAEGLEPDSVRGRFASYGGGFARKVKELGLIYAAALRFQLDIKPQLSEHKASAQEGDMQAKAASENAMDLILRGLKEEYGEKLYILYTPSQPFSADAPEEPQERELLAECKAKGIACRSVRDRMVKDLVVNHKLARGFSDFAPGVGHLNASGHEEVADELDDWLNSSR